MAVNVPPWAFVKLKLRVTRNGLRGQTRRVVLFVLAVLWAVWMAAAGYLVFLLPGLLDDAKLAGSLPVLGGAALVLGWLFLPLIFFGVDETLDPARFALLPLGRRTLITGLFAASLAGIPAVATLLATLGIVHTSALLGGVVAGLVQLVGVLLGIALCAVLSRAVTSAFATALRSRRARDLATVAFALLAALIGPLQLLVRAGAENADWDRVASVARIVAWTPLGAPYSLGLDVAAGRAWAVPVKLLIVVASIVLLLRWWSATLEQAMIGTASGKQRNSKPARGAAVAQLLFRGLPPTRFGALVAREVRYWSRENRRRAALISFAVVGVFLPVMLTLTGSNGGGRAALMIVGAIAAINLVNQFGFEGSAYAANMTAGVPGRVEVVSRAAGLTVYVLPLLVVIAVVVGVVSGTPAGVPSLFGMLLAAYGVGLGVVLPVSVPAAYALPDSTNPFAMSSGGGPAKGLLAFGAMLGTVLLSLPLLIAGFLLGDAWNWIGLPAGALWGAGAFLLGSTLAGRLLDRRMPELLAAVTPNR